MPSESHSKLDLKKNRIRAFFNSLKPGGEGKAELPEDLQKIEREGMPYIQLRLPVSTITEEFETKVKEKVENNVIRAEIREATPQDLDIIKDIYNKAWLTSSTPFRAIDTTTLNTIFEDGDTVFLIAKVYGKDAGFIILDVEEEGKIATIAALGVLPRFQRRGLGTMMGIAAWNYFKKKVPNIQELRAEVYKENQVSYNFIKALGFEEFGIKRYKKEDFEID
jgi:ribosomal protein S18 acetylase RimI-like enzyme